MDLIDKKTLKIKIDWIMCSNINKYSTLNNRHNRENTNKHLLPIATIKLRKVQFSNWFMHMCYYRFVDGKTTFFFINIIIKRWKS